MAPSTSSELPFEGLLTLTTMTLATSGLDGELHAAPVYFAANTTLVSGEAPQLYFFSDPDSQHSWDVVANSQAAAAIYPECQEWQDIRGLQLRGHVQEVPPGAEWEVAWKFYIGKFPFVQSLKEIVARNALYVFSAQWIRLVDNRRGFGFKQEWIFP